MNIQHEILIIEAVFVAVGLVLGFLSPRRTWDWHKEDYTTTIWARCVSATAGAAFTGVLGLGLIVYTIACGGPR